MDLFRQAGREEVARHAPLATRMRPRTLEELVGQEHLLGPGKVLRRLLEEDRIPSMILWGPPGSGKTTLARLMAGTTSAHFEPLSAVSAGVADLRRIVAEARERRDLHGRRTLLFLDEIHRFNKAQQDAVLPHVEEGLLTLVGATTENPSFEVNPALLSRCRVFVLQALTEDQVETLLRRALQRELAGREAVAGALKILAERSGGDARIALNSLEIAADLAGPGRPIDEEAVREALARPGPLYDRTDQHYQVISAYIKSLRGSDPDAALYWLARMLEGGEDPLFVARRQVILASEDVGLADPQALVVAVAAQQAVHLVGMPEGFYPLAQATLYLATAPKSNSVGAAYARARREVLRTPGAPVPLHLRNAVTGLDRALGFGKGYRYAHDYPDHHVEEDYFPEGVRERRYYEPGSLGYEERIAAWMRRLRGKTAPEPGVPRCPTPRPAGDG